MRHRSDTPQELGGHRASGGEGHLGVLGVWGCGASGGAGRLVGLRHRPRCPRPAHMPDAEAE